MTTYYFASETGSDANDGLSPANAKQSLGTTASNLILSGNELLFRCGERHAFTSLGATGWAVTGKLMAGGAKIGMYDDDVSPYEPLFDAGTYWTSSDDGNWTSLGDGRWTRAINGSIGRVFAGTTVATVKARSWGQPMRRRAAATDPSATLQYHDSSTVLTIYNGSNVTAPPTYYGGLCVSGNGICTSETAHFQRCQNIEIEHWAFANCRNGLQITTLGTNDSVNMTVRDCKAYAPHRSGNGFRVSSSTAGFYVRDTRLIRCMADNKRQATEEDNDSTLWSSNNGFALSGQVINCDIVDPVVRGGFGHSMIQFQCIGQATKYIGRGLHIYRTRKDMGIMYSESDYEKPFDGDFDGFLIQDIEVRSQITRSQIGGRGLIRGVKVVSTRPPEHTQNLSTGQIWWHQNWDSAGNYRAVKDITYEGCMVINPYGTPFENLEDRTDAALGTESDFRANAIKIINCLIVDLSPGGGRTYSFNHEVQGSPFAAPQVTTIKNTIFVTATSSPIRHEETSGAFTTRSVNTTAGGYAGSFNLRASTVAAAGLDGSYYPTAAGVADGTGDYLRAMRDADGRRFNNPPAIGAREKRLVRAPR
jgi:hypothetical protein